MAVDRDADGLKRAVEALPASAEALSIVADVTSEDDVASYVRQAVDKMGGLHIFFNNAGIEGILPLFPITRSPPSAGCSTSMSSAFFLA